MFKSDGILGNKHLTKNINAWPMVRKFHQNMEAQMQKMFYDWRKLIF